MPSAILKRGPVGLNPFRDSCEVEGCKTTPFRGTKGHRRMARKHNEYGRRLQQGVCKNPCGLIIEEVPHGALVLIQYSHTSTSVDKIR